MELKNYQKNVLQDLSLFMDAVKCSERYQKRLEGVLAVQGHQGGQRRRASVPGADSWGAPCVHESPYWRG